MGKSNKKLIASYVIDVLLLVVLAAIGGALNYVPPTRRLFSLTDPTISYPNLPDTVSVTVLFLAAVVAPAAIVCAVTLLFVTLPDHRGLISSHPLVWRRKLWELFTGILGLAFSVILGFFLTQAGKNLFGKPRPDFLSRCNPDLENYSQYVDDGYTSEALEGTSVHVTHLICRSINGTSKDVAALNDGFRSFPSGHCTIAFVGFIYLSLFIAAKFSVAIPSLSPTPRNSAPSFRPINNGGLLQRSNPRTETAAPPLYLFVLAFIPTGAAIYVAASRFTDYKHHGFDVFFSAVEGIICAWVGFRWYHMPVRRGAGWAWGPRSNDRAFGIRIGEGTYHKSARREEAVQDPERAREDRTTPAASENIELNSFEQDNSIESSQSRARILRGEA